jgi:hypothetical protein
MPFSQTPTRHSRFVDNKHQTPIRLSGDRTVEALFQLVIETVLAISNNPLLVPGFQVSFTALHPEVLADSSRFERANQERIEGIAIFFRPFPRARKKARCPLCSESGNDVD